MVKTLSDHETIPEQSGPGNGQVIDPAFADVSDLEGYVLVYSGTGWKPVRVSDRVMVAR
jgi:hypothetical protein